MRHELQADRAARGARVWSLLARGIFGILILTILGFGVYLTFENLALRDELSTALDDLAAARAETISLYEQIQEDPAICQPTPERITP